MLFPESVYSKCKKNSFYLCDDFSIVKICLRFLWSISSSIYARIFCTKVFFGSFFYLHVTREKLPKRHSYEKFGCKMLMKLTPGRSSGLPWRPTPCPCSGRTVKDFHPELNYFQFHQFFLRRVKICCFHSI